MAFSLETIKKNIHKSVLFQNFFVNMLTLLFLLCFLLVNVTEFRMKGLDLDIRTDFFII